jgi:hypothetical protein
MCRKHFCYRIASPNCRHQKFAPHSFNETDIVSLAYSGLAGFFLFVVFDFNQIILNSMNAMT